MSHDLAQRIRSSGLVSQGQVLYRGLRAVLRMAIDEGHTTEEIFAAFEPQHGHEPDWTPIVALVLEDLTIEALPITGCPAHRSLIPPHALPRDGAAAEVKRLIRLQNSKVGRTRLMAWLDAPQRNRPSKCTRPAWFALALLNVPAIPPRCSV